MTKDPMEFIHNFISYANSEGIYDEYDKDSNKMKTSAGMQALINSAKEFFPELPKGATAALMRNLTEDERNKAIEGTPKVIDMRAEFAKKMSANEGARGLVTQLAEASKTNDVMEMARIITMAQTFTEYENGEKE